MENEFETEEYSVEEEQASDENQEVVEEEEEFEEVEKPKKNPSNFKKLSKALKGATATIKELEDKLASYDEKVSTPKIDTTELRLFLIETPEAKDYKDVIQETLSKYPDMTLEDAYAFAKTKAPKSQDKDDFNLKNRVAQTKKKLEDLSPEEALKLDNKSYLEYMRKTGKLKF